ncbi:MAG: hypothetical protein KGJ89_00170 [Patescibacteria group bacterium]|nr:hypothetical protein [Patescibacteria group bacterium]MDE2014936.1 hypothetical protein [Patescibacteria group bacterium]MDE2226365.1 hypothetical protein [Patescibacteria group bacterium]
MSNRNGDKSKKAQRTVFPPTTTETGLNTGDYDFQYLNPLHDGQMRMLVSPKPHVRALFGSSDKRKSSAANDGPIKIKSVRFDDNMIIINNGQEALPLNSRKNLEGTKIIKIIKVLWEGRFEMKGNAIVSRRPRTMSVKNLKFVTGARTEGAVIKQITRFNSRIAEKMIPIRIDRTRTQCRLVIKLG